MNFLKNERSILSLKSSIISILIAHSIFFFNSYYMNNVDCYVLEGASIHLSSGRYIGCLLQYITTGFGFLAVIKPVNFIISMIFIILIILLILEIFDVRNKMHIILFSLLFPVQPCIIQTLGFQFVSHFDFLSELLMVLAVYLILNKKQIILPILFIVLSLGIYQAYLPIGICLIFIYIFKNILISSSDTAGGGIGNYKKYISSVVKDVVRYIIIFTVSIFIYIIINKVVLNIYDLDMYEYQNFGKNVISDISIFGYLDRIRLCYVHVFDTVFSNYGNICEFPIISYFLSVYIIIFLIKLICKIHNDKFKLFATLFLLIISPIVFDFSYFMAGISVNRIQTSLYFIILMPIIIDDIYYRNVNLENILLFFSNNSIRYLSIILLCFSMLISIGEHYNLYILNKDFERYMNYVVNCIISHDEYKDGMTVFTVGDYKGPKYQGSINANNFYKIHEKPNINNITWEYAIGQYFLLYGSVNFRGKCTEERKAMYADRPCFPDTNSMWGDKDRFYIKFSD